MRTEQLARDLVGKKSRRLIDWQSIFAAIEPHAGSGIGSTLADCLAETQPPRPFFGRRVAENAEQVFTRER